MDGNGLDYPLDMEVEEVPASVISIEQLQRLVQLLDQSDVTELEFERASEGMHLALRKIVAPVAEQQTAIPGVGQVAQVATAPSAAGQAEQAPSETQEPRHRITAPLVGTFHVWAKPRGGALVAVGDKVKVGQLVGTIQSLNVLNEVETSVAGRVIEVLVQDGQPVEYGQVLMTIDGSDGAKSA